MVEDVKPGARYRSAVCDTEVIVIKARRSSLDIRCGGQPVVALGEPLPENLVATPAFTQGTLLGKRYTDDEEILELLCTKGGTSSLSLGGTALQVKEAKPLPSSD